MKRISQLQSKAESHTTFSKVLKARNDQLKNKHNPIAGFEKLTNNSAIKSQNKLSDRALKDAEILNNRHGIKFTNDELEKAAKEIDFSSPQAQKEAQAKLNAQARDSFPAKKGFQLTSGEKKLLIGAGIATAIVAAPYAERALNQYKITHSPLASKNLAETERQWQALFGDAYHIPKAPKGFGFHVSLSSGLAMDRPEFTIPKGTVFQRLSRTPEDVTDYTKGAYSTFLSNDNNLYASGGEFGKLQYAIHYTAKSDVKVPDVKTVLQHLSAAMIKKDGINVYNTNPKNVLDTYKSMSGGQWRKSALGQSLFDSLRAAGYSAIVDEMDAGYLGHLPVVFFGDAVEKGIVPRTDKDYAIAKQASVLLYG